MKPSKKAVQLFNSLKSSEVRELAYGQNNLSLLLELYETEDYEEISRKLDVYNDYLAYLKKMNDFLCSNAVKNAGKIARLVSGYHTFLLERICLPR